MDERNPFEEFFGRPYSPFFRYMPPHEGDLGANKANPVEFEFEFIVKFHVGDVERALSNLIELIEQSGHLAAILREIIGDEKFSELIATLLAIAKTVEDAATADTPPPPATD